MKKITRASSLFMIILFGLFLGSRAILKNSIDLGNLVAGDELYIDAESFINNDFKSNPGYFVYPTYDKSAFEMFSVPKREYQATIPEECDSLIAVFKSGAVMSCRNRIKFFSFQEQEFNNAFRLPENTKCQGKLYLKESQQILTVCRKQIGRKNSKLYIASITTDKKNPGEINLIKKPLLTTNGFNDFEFIAYINQNFQHKAVFWSRPSLYKANKVNRFENNVFYLLDLHKYETTPLSIDFSNLEEEMANINYAHMEKHEEDGQFYFSVIIRGFMKSQTYKVRRYQTVLECYWDMKSTEINRCRELFFQQNGPKERLQGSLLDVLVTHSSTTENKKTVHHRNIEFVYNLPSKSGTLLKKVLTYQVSQYSHNNCNRGETSVSRGGYKKKMIKNQYVPIAIKDNIIFYKDKFNKKIRLALWYGHQGALSIRYIDAVGFSMMLDGNLLCSYDANEMQCYEWASNAYLKSETHHISKAYRNFYFYLNHCDRINCHKPKTLEIKAKIDRGITLTRKSKARMVKLKVLAKKNRYVHLASARTMLTRSSVRSFQEVSPKNVDVFVEKKVKVLLKYFNPDTKEEETIEKSRQTYYIGSQTLHCDLAKCSLYLACKDYNLVNRVEKVCYEKIDYPEVNKNTALNIFTYSEFIVIHKKTISSGLFVINTTTGIANLYLNDKITGDPLKLSLSFSGYKIYVSTLGSNGQVKIYQIGIDKKVQVLLKSFEVGRCCLNIASSSNGGFTVSIYSKCKDSSPKFTTFQSANMQTFNKVEFLPRASLLGDEKLRGFCLFKTGQLFVTVEAIFFVNSQSKIFIKSNPFGRNNYSVKCLYNGLIAFLTKENVNIFDVYNYFKQRYRNAMIYKVKDANQVFEGKDGHFYVSAGANLDNIEFLNLNWKRINAYGKFRESTQLTAELDTGVPNDKTSNIEMEIVIQDDKSLNGHKYFNRTKLMKFNSTQSLYNLEPMLNFTKPFWTIAARVGTEGKNHECFNPRVRFSVFNEAANTRAFDTHKGKLYYVTPSANGGSSIKVNDPQAEGEDKEIARFDGLCDFVNKVQNSEEFVLFTHCKDIGYNRISMITQVDDSYVVISEPIHTRFNRMESIKVGKSSYLLLLFSSTQRRLSISLFTIKKIGEIKNVEYRRLSVLNEIVEFRFGIYGERVYLFTQETGSLGTWYHSLNFYDKEVYITNRKNIAPYSLANIINWDCKRQTEKNLECVVVYSGSIIQYMEFSYNEEKEEIELQEIIDIPAYDAIVVEKVSFMNSGHISLRFFKMLNNSGNRSDDHYGFYLLFINPETHEVDQLGGIGQEAMQHEAIKLSRFRIRGFNGGLLFKLRSTHMGLLSFGNAELTCLTKKMLASSSRLRIQINEVGSTRLNSLHVNDLFEPVEEEEEKEEL